MSRKLQSQIQDIKGLPGRFKRILLAWASFANNDGTNIFPAKEKVAERAGVSRWTVYDNTDILEAAGGCLSGCEEGRDALRLGFRRDDDSGVIIRFSRPRAGKRVSMVGVDFYPEDNEVVGKVYGAESQLKYATLI